MTGNHHRPLTTLTSLPTATSDAFQSLYRVRAAGGGLPDRIYAAVNGAAGAPVWTRLDDGGGGGRNILDVLDPVAADHTAAFKAAVEAAPNVAWQIPPGFLVKLSYGVSAASGGTTQPNLPSGTRIVGAGQGSGFQLLSYVENGTYAGIDVYGTRSDIRLADLAFLGDGPSPATYTNGQAGALVINGTSAAEQDIHIERCLFRQLKGFTVHAYGLESHLWIADNAFQDCGNGQNINANGGGLVFRGNRSLRTKGLETSGPYHVVEGNYFDSMLGTAISVGGYQSSSVSNPGGRVAHNQIVGVAANNGIGIQAAESSPDLAIVGNYVEQAYVGIQADGGAGTSSGAGGHLISGNHIVSAQHIGIVVQTRCDHARVLGNRVYNKAGLPSAMIEGGEIWANDVLFDGNMVDVSNGANWAVTVAGAQRLIWGPNNLLAGGTGQKLQLLSSPTFASAEHVGRDVYTTSSDAVPAQTDRFVQMSTTGANRVCLLPTAVGLVGKRFLISKQDADAHTIAVTPNGAEKINGAATKTLSGQYTAIEIVSDGANWLIAGQQGTVT